MLDSVLLPLVNRPLSLIAAELGKKKVTADQVSWVGFGLGLLAVPFILLNWYYVALFFILANRIADGIDGALARLTQKTDSGAFLDICLDFFFYNIIVFAFAWAAPGNTFWAMLLMLSFVGTSTTFLAFAILAEKQKIAKVRYPNKGFVFLGGITEGTETILFFIAFCIWPQHFAWLAAIFSALCLLTAGMRLYYGHQTLRPVLVLPAPEELDPMAETKDEAQTTEQPKASKAAPRVTSKPDSSSSGSEDHYDPSFNG